MKIHSKKTKMPKVNPNFQTQEISVSGDFLKFGVSSFVLLSGNTGSGKTGFIIVSCYQIELFGFVKSLLKYDKYPLTF